jgi:molybdopterin synthase catalytic subunit
MGNRGVTVLAFGSAVDVLGWAEREFPLPADATLGGVVAVLEREHPRLIEGRGRLRYAVNQQYATSATALRAGDEVAIIPPVAGGDSAADAPAAARLVREPIDIAALHADVAEAGIGAVATFAGLVREETAADGSLLRALEYTAYEPMARGEMQRVCDAALKDFAVQRVVLVHRLGTLRIGEASVAVVVSAAHRGAALDACRAVIEGLKASVPIFKREVWASGATSWVEPA